MSHAKGHKFAHNNLQALEVLLKAHKQSSKTGAEMYVVTEAVFSMDGDIPPLNAIATLCKKYKAFLIVDQAHATGVVGPKGKGLIQELAIEDLIFARIVTFGKALGCHGAAILGSGELKNYLVNFARSFIYTTALPAHALATIGAAYTELENNSDVIKKLQNNITLLQGCIVKEQLTPYFIKSTSAIHSCVIKGNKATKDISVLLQQNKFDVKAILSPTVPKGQERLRICLHSYNTKEDITTLVRLLKEFLTP